MRTRPSKILKTKGEKKPYYDGSEICSDSRESTLVIHGEREGQVLEDATGDEVPTDDINHDDMEEKPPVTPASALVLRRSNRDRQPSRRYIMFRIYLAHRFK